MRVLFIYPVFPSSFWSFDKTIELLGRKALLPPLGLATIAAMMPQEWEFKLVDRNVREITEAEWQWADMVMLSAMIVQQDDLREQIAEAKRRGKPVAIGGPYPTAFVNECEASGADYLVLDEGEVTVPMFLEAMARGEKTGIYRSDGVKPDITGTPIPRFDLLQLDQYSEMSVQFSRGCPFLCEFCDIIVLYGRKPRTKNPSQILAELQVLYDLGWRRSIFMVDDNFIGNKKNVKVMLNELLPWMQAHNYPFTFSTEASVDLAQDQELMDLMVQCNFGAVFLGVETPDTESLALTKKSQNNRDPLTESIAKISRSGIRIMAGFIIGFDNERKGAGQRIVEFVEETAIPTAAYSMLQALPDTGLWKRLITENRLLEGMGGDVNQTTLMNFVPTRPMEEIAREYVKGFWDLYDPKRYMKRTLRHYMQLKHGKFPKKPSNNRKKLDKAGRNALLKIIYRQGVLRETRWLFWKQLVQMLRHNKKGIGSYLSTCAQAEHFLSYREMVKREINAALEKHLALHSKVAADVAPKVSAQPGSKVSLAVLSA